MINSIVRKKEYKDKVWSNDYFVIKHLKDFLDAKLKQFIKKGSIVGDIGCGEQPLRKLIESLGGTYMGIDVNQNLSNTVQVISDIASLPLSDNYFDVIICTEVLEHVSDTYRAVKEIGRVLKRGGKVIITTPFSYQLHEEPLDFVRLTPYQITKCSEGLLKVSELNIAGNEIEVIATVWGNMWFRIVGTDGPIKKAFLAAMCLPVNILTIIASAAFRKVLPRKDYLSALVVLTKD